MSWWIMPDMWVKAISETTPGTTIDFTLPVHLSGGDDHARIPLSEPPGRKYVAIRGLLNDL
jgi:hypothetical protein